MQQQQALRGAHRALSATPYPLQRPAALPRPVRAACCAPSAALQCAGRALVPARPCPLHQRQQQQHQQQLGARQQDQRRQQQRRRVAARVLSPWGTQIDGQSIASQLFALSLFPYLGFLFHLTRSGQAPRLVLGGFYFLLVFVGATIPAGIYAKTHYGTSLANVDWLHGGAESLLTVTNLLLVLGLRQAIREAEAKNAAAAAKGAEDGGAAAPAAASEAVGGKPRGE
ncbi:hypothetical protein Rsub_08105 [Raphidocelis subcapitata]|uniref:DUF3593 domain-containing protein n=1 Tax=Raphidocelis subcapitata TaxID=307507 RepID=A0A2V0PAL2_9CHLO|nr:hypothetical protein Rsub_08105 [Raphidocelis subcapitata]|eukprot:GBF95982.1 hypothetical protein Rsub_08105 [Raphidocelis subcapitata]